MTNKYPYDWYWLADDERLFSSARQEIVQTSDQAYADWQSLGNFATAWPRDDEGNQSAMALQAVLSSYGIYVDLHAYAAARRFAIETGGIVVNGIQINTSRESQSMIVGAYNYVLANPKKTIRFKTVSGWTDLDAAAVTAIANAIGTHVQDCFALEAQISADIDSGAISEIAAIDAIAWPSNG